MPFCSNCGKELKAGAKFCQECGAPASSATGPVARSMPAPEVRSRRPTLATVISVLDLVVGPIFIILGSLYLVLAVPPSVAALSTALGITGIITGVLAILSGYALLKARGWGRWTGAASDLGLVVVGLVLALPHNSWVADVGMVALVSGVVSAYYLFMGGASSYLK